MEQPMGTLDLKKKLSVWNMSGASELAITVSDALPLGKTEQQETRGRSH